LVITNTSYNAGQATLTVNFNTPSNNGCGDPLHFIVNIDGSLNQVNYDEDDTSYSQTFTLNVSQTGNVEVYLVTRDTNPSVPGGSTYPERNGASITTPYIATDLVLESVNYQVYDYPDSQNMVLTWNSQEDGNWDASYNVQYQVRTPQGTPLNNDDWLDASTNLVSTAYTFDASGVACNSTVYFRIVANLVNNTPNPDVNYQTISAPVSINMFRYATAPEYANVLWASADGSYNFMDIRMVFKNPASIGCGGAVKFVVNVLDASGNILKYYGTNNPATRDVSYNEVDPSPSYEVNFDGVTYASIGNVQVYLVTTDTNNVTIARNGARSNAGYLAARLPIYQDVSMNDDRNLLTFKVITQTPLVLVNGAITGELVGVLPVLTAYQWNSNGTTPGVTVNVTALANDELQYEIAMDPTVVDSPFPNPFSEPWGLLVANDVGIQEYNVDGLN
jgi:hypothetical protein